MEKSQTSTRIYIGLIVILFIIAFTFMSTSDINAQSGDQIIYDYVILIDTSGSMSENNSPLFGQVQEVAQNFVTEIQEGSNLAVYSFDTTAKQIGYWDKISYSDKQQINATIGDMKATGSRTALWDSVCEGLNQLDKMAQTDGQHIQLLISYTDGEDNNSTNTSEYCLAKYQDMQKDGYTYWIYNAIGGVSVPSSVTDLQDIIGIVDSPNPLPIRVAHVLPLELNLGNLYASGRSNPDTSCLVFWASDPTIYGTTIQFASAPISDRTLPSGSTSQICANGTDCERSISISTNAQCLQFNLINYVKEQIGNSNIGSYSLTLPLQVAYSNPGERIFVVPNAIKIGFQLNYPPTATPTSTKTPLPTATSTPLPLPTATPLPPNTVLNCGGSQTIDFGSINLQGISQDISRNKNCTMDWQPYLKTQSFVAKLYFDEKKNDNQLLSQFIDLSNEENQAKTLNLTESDKEFHIFLNIPKNQWTKFKTGKFTFNGEIQLTPTDTKLVGDIDADKLIIPVKFQIIKPASPLFFIIGFCALIAIILAILIPKILKASMPPSFNAVLIFDNGMSDTRIKLIEKKPKTFDSRMAILVCGQMPECDVVLPQDTNLGAIYFKLIAEKNAEKVDISILPVEPLSINEMPVASKRILKSRDQISVGELVFRISIQ